MYFSVHALHDLAKQLLSEDGLDYVLSDKFNQDPLLEHFGKQRSRVGSNENPSLREYLNNERKFLVAKSEMIVSCEEILVVDKKKRPLTLLMTICFQKERKKGN